MKLITRDTDYALRAICCIVKGNKKIVSVAELVRELKMPRPFLRKILQTLNKKGILSSYKGQGGGFILAKPVNKIYLLELMRIFQGEFLLNECLFKKDICPNVRRCALRKKMNGIEQHVLKELRSITVGSLLR